MKKYLIYTMLALTVLTACKKSYNVAPADLPEAKVAATLAAYSKLLTSSTYGWKAILNPYGGGIYLFSMKFGADNRVTMLSDLNATTAATAATSSYIVKQQQAPSLLFDTYNYIHLLADPDPAAAGGASGEGLYSDIEFYIDNAKGDTINLIGNKLGSKLILIKAASAIDYSSFIIGTTPVLAQLSQIRTYFKRLTIGTTDVELRIDPAKKVFVFSYIDGGGNLVSLTSSFYVDGLTNTIVLLSPVTIGSTLVSTMKSITTDAANHIVSFSINGAPVQMRESTTPLKIDATSPQRWRTQLDENPNGAWISYTAFHYGVDDYCNFKAVANYASFWYAGAGVFGSSGYEGIFGLVNGGLSTQQAISNPFTSPSPGIGRFKYLGAFGTFTGATPIAVAMTSARAIMFGIGTSVGNFQDWYFIQTNTAGTKYDMVRVGDAQAWISWETLKQ